MNNILDQQIKTTSVLISKAAYSDSLDIFTVHDLAASLCIHSNATEATMILERRLRLILISALFLRQLVFLLPLMICAL